VHKVRVEDGLTWQAFLSEAERARADQFRWRADRDRFVAGRGAMRWYVGQAIGSDPAELSFGEGPFGKPFVLGKRHVHFNVSHSGDWVLIVLAKDEEVGVDVELAQADLDFMEVAPSVFTAAETSTLLALPADLGRTAFYRLWARKEAVLKAWGVGLSLDARAVHVGLDAAARTVVDAVGDYPPAMVEDVAVDLTHVGAVAWVGTRT